MAEMIKISQSEIETLAKKINSKSDDAKTFLTQVQSVVDEAHNVWQGASSDKFHDQFSTLKSQVQSKLEEYLDSLSKALLEVAKALRDADDEIAGKINFGG